MTTYKTSDVDGMVYWVAAETAEKARDFARKVRRLTEAHGCKMREVPTLGALQAKWHHSFDVTHEHGVVVGIRRRDAGGAS